jgi:hypothetical protein
VIAKTRMAPPVDPDCIPVELVIRFAATAALERLIVALSFIAKLPCELAMVANNHDI